MLVERQCRADEPNERRSLVKRRTALENEVSAVPMRCLAPRPPASDPFGAKGRAWMADLTLTLSAGHASGGRPRLLRSAPAR